MQTNTANSIFYYSVRALGYPLDMVLKFLAQRYTYFFWIVTRSPEKLFWVWGRFNLYRCFLHARLNVPAFAKFRGRPGMRELFQWNTLPETDKENYIKAYATSERCVDGKIPFRNTLVDESSGSSGQA